MTRVWLLGVSGLAIGAICVGLLIRQLAAEESLEFAGPIELQFWAGASQSGPEPIVDPRDIADVVAACVEAPSAIEACAARRKILVDTFGRAMQDTGALRVVAKCLAESCDATVPLAPANACLFWQLYFERRPDQVGAIDRASREQSCARARFGSDDRRMATVRLWNRTVSQMKRF